jgi:hypothetical protein
MAFLERKRMGDKYRKAITATVLTYIDTAKQMRSDPLGLAKLSPTGSIVLGGELRKATGKKHSFPDSVWWVTINPDTGRMRTPVLISTDLSKWRKKLNKQLEDEWGRISAVKRLAKKRATTGAIVAAVTTAAVIAIVLTAGGAAPGVAAGASSASAGAGGAAGAAGAGGAAGAAGTAKAAAGTTVKVLSSLKAISQAASQGKDLEGQAQAATQSMPPETAAVVVTEAQKEVARKEAPFYTQPPFLIGAGVVSIVVLGFLTRPLWQRS